MARDLYGSFGSAPEKTSVTGSGGRASGVRADANDFGAQIGQSAEKLGAALDHVSEAAKKQQDVINETLASEMEIKYAGDLASLTGGYQSLSGLQAHAALPKYTQDVAALRQKYAEALPDSARRSFDTLAMRHEKSAIFDANKYSVMEVAKADKNTAAAAISMAVTQAGYAPVAKNDYRFGEALGDIHANVARQFSDAPGLEQDENGYFKFTDTPEGKATEGLYTQTIDKATGDAWLNRFQTLANEDPISAFEKYKADKEEIPSQFQVALDAFFYPRVRDAYADGIAGTTIGSANEGYSVAYANSAKIDSVSVILKNELHADGVIRVHSDGDGQAIGGINSNAFPEQFAEASRILRDDGQSAAKKYISDFYQKEIIEKNGIDKLPAAVQDIVADGVVNHRGEIQRQLIDAAKSGATPQQLIDIRRKEYDRLAATGEKKYVDARDGWDKRLDALQSGVSKKDAGAVPPPTNADYYRDNYNEITQNARNAAEQQRPGDQSFADLAESKTKNYLDSVIKKQSEEYKGQAKTLYQATTGVMTGGNRPASLDAIRAINPQMKSLVDDIQINQPEVYNAVSRQLRVAANAAKPKLDIEDQNESYSKIFDEVAQLNLTSKGGKVKIGKENVTFADMARLQKKIVSESNRGVTGLRTLMNKITPATLKLASDELGYDDVGWKFFGEPVETYDPGYQTIQSYLEKQGKDKDYTLKSRMLSDFVEAADAIPEDVRSNPDLFNTQLASTANRVIAGQAKQGTMKNIPIPAIQNLKLYPDTAPQFDEIFGIGAAKKILGN